MRRGFPEAGVVCAVFAVCAPGYAVGRASARDDADAVAARRAAYAAAFPLGRSQGARFQATQAKRILGARAGP